MKQQGNSTSSKAISTTENVNNSEAEEISNIEFQNLLARMINKPKRRHVS
jgi:hypothetical protein